MQLDDLLEWLRSGVFGSGENRQELTGGPGGPGGPLGPSSPRGPCVGKKTGLEFPSEDEPQAGDGHSRIWKDLAGAAAASLSYKLGEKTCGHRPFSYKPK